MGSKIIEAAYMPDEGASYVVKAGRWGTFADVAVCAEADRDIASDFTGCNFAEYKCDIQAQREKAKYYKARFDGIDMAYNNLKQSIPTSEDVMISLYRQRNVAWRDYKQERARYMNMRKGYKAYTEAVLKSRKNLLDRIQEVEE